MALLNAVKEWLGVPSPVAKDGSYWFSDSDWEDGWDRLALSSEPAIGEPALGRRVLDAARRPDDAGSRFGAAIQLRRAMIPVISPIGWPYTVWHFEAEGSRTVALGLLPSHDTGYRTYVFNCDREDTLRLKRVMLPRALSLSTPLIINPEKLPMLMTEQDDSVERFYREWTLAAIAERRGGHNATYFPEDSLRDLRATRARDLPSGWEDWDRVAGLISPDTPMAGVYEHSADGAAIAWFVLLGAWPTASIREAQRLANQMLPRRHIWVRTSAGRGWLVVHLGTKSDGIEQSLRALALTRSVLVRTRCHLEGIEISQPDESATLLPPAADLAGLRYAASGVELWKLRREGTDWSSGWGATQKDRVTELTSTSFGGLTAEQALMEIRLLESPLSESYREVM